MTPFILPTIALVFPTINSLWKFANSIDINQIEVNLKRKTLYCDCKDVHTKLAIENYGAKVINVDTQKSA
jgi:hypothetical protein